MSDGSETVDDGSKKPREGSSGNYTDEADIFEKDVESDDCWKVLFNCLKNLEEKINDPYMLANSNKEMQIKGDKKLTDLTSSVEFLTSKFNGLRRKEKKNMN